MSPMPVPSVELRRHPRMKLPAMYTLARIRLIGSSRYQWSGHIYDLSMGGMRFELDQPIPAGSTIEVRGMLPGQQHTTFRAVGRVVRIHDHEGADAGPIRMAMTFDEFPHPIDENRLSTYLDQGLRLAA